MTNKSEFSISKTRNKLLLYVGIMIVLNFLLHTIIHSGPIFNSDGSNEFIIGLSKTILIGMPMTGCIIGLLLSFIPFKNLIYFKKLILATLSSTFILSVIYFILGLAGQVFK